MLLACGIILFPFGWPCYHPDTLILPSPVYLGSVFSWRRRLTLFSPVGRLGPIRKLFNPIISKVTLFFFAAPRPRLAHRGQIRQLCRGSARASLQIATRCPLGNRQFG